MTELHKIKALLCEQARFNPIIYRYLKCLIHASPPENTGDFFCDEEAVIGMLTVLLAERKQIQQTLENCITTAPIPRLSFEELDALLAEPRESGVGKKD